MKYSNYNLPKSNYYVFILLFFISCKKDHSTVINNISGYWEIEHVKFSDGSKKNYTINETIDYIEVNKDRTGFRKKMKPTFSGTYITSENKQSFKIKIENDSLNVYYKSAYTSWKETILSSSKKHLEIVNQNNVVYLYKRYTPLNLE